MRLMALIAAMAMSVAVTGGAAKADLLQDVKARGKLVCATLANVEPLGFQDAKTRELVGFDVDTCTEIAKRLGVAVEIHPVTTEARIPELVSGRVDLSAGALGFTKERAQQIDYTAAHYQTANRIMVKTGSGLTKLAELDGKKISATKGGTPEIYARQKLPNATILTFQDPPSAFLAMQQDKVVGFAVSEMGGLKFKTESAGEVAFIDEPLAWEATGLGVRKGEPAFLAAVNQALADMEKEGMLDRLWDKWYGPTTAFKVKRDKKLTPISAFAN